MPAPNSKKSKTSRFPVARIKKIMQMDEEVGKLASATPVMISKSLECFMQALLNDAAVEASRRGSKKLTAYHLKQTINTNETFDFLREIVATIPDPTEAPAPTHAGGSGSGAGLGRPRKQPSTSGGGGRKPKQGDLYSYAPQGTVPETKVGGLPDIGTWKRDMTGGGGTGEGGRGMYDDYDVDEDDF